MTTWKPTRREIFRGAGALAGLGGLVAVAGCGSATGLPAALDEVTERGAGKPTRGGVLRYGLSTDPSNFEPQVSSGAASDVIRQMVYNGLLQYDAKGEIVGDLAESFGWVNPTTFEVTLHPEVYFHDGSRMTAGDVVFSFKRLADPKTAATVQQLLQGFDHAVARSDQVVHFVLTEPNAAFPFALAAPTANIVSQKWIESGADPKLQVMGTGPFRFIERIPGVSITLERFDRYFIPELPYLNAIQFMPMGDDYARVTALRSATVDMIDYVPATHIDVIRNNPRLDFYSDATFGFGMLGFVTDKAPFNDVRVRRAVAMSLDRTAILETAFLSHGQPMTGGLIAQEIAPYAKSLDGSVPYDPEQAKFLLKQAGQQDLKLPVVTTSSYSVIQRPAEASLPSLRRSGIQVGMQQQEWLAFQETVKAQTFPAFSWGTAVTYGDPDALRNFIGTGNVWAKYMNFSDAKVDSLLKQGRQTQNQGLRDDIYKSVEQRVLELMPWTYTVRRVQGEAAHTYVKNFVHPPKGAWTQVSLRGVWLERER